ncbi:hypothetical protein RA086_09055 [Lactiplantibacillus sp. WILCCON 0030]|uniref:Uncharacterized protein n=1 Tax=Lactiplantibacillus brownii TaxID=3069269 RepID=A0ABU1AAU1_9LACO|nr:hypothetical protein [Lactiplantibacillus brownii]MDQ7937755.1 hypothetical protein [Lactiplantibacillus brownii]
MTVTSEAFNQYLEQNNLGVNYYSYFYSEANRIDADSMSNLVAPEKHRLIEKRGRYDLYDEHGVLYMQGRDKYDFEHLIPKLLSGQKLTPLDLDVPNLSVVMDLIHQANKLGFRVIGSNQKRETAWKVVDDRLLMQAVLADTDYAQLVQAVMADGPVMVNLEHDLVMTQLKPAEVVEQAATVSYAIFDEDNQMIISGFGLEKLGAVLCCLILGIRPEDIVALLLIPRGIGADRLALASLLFEEHQTSELREVTSISDMKFLENAPIINDEDHYVAKYRFYDAEKKVAWSDEIADVSLTITMYYLTHEQSADVQKAGKKLSDALLKLAQKNGLVITRCSRLLEDTSIADEFSLVNGALDDCTLTQEPGRFDQDLSDHLFETVYGLYDHSTEGVQYYDLSFGDLVTTLFAGLRIDATGTQSINQENN